MFYAKMLNCAQMSISFKYLGISVGGNPRKKEFSKEVLDKVRRKLSLWKCKNLTFTRRVCLIKSIFTAIPLYLSLLKIPVSIYKDLKSLQRKFLWG